MQTTLHKPASKQLSTRPSTSAQAVQRVTAKGNVKLVAPKSSTSRLLAAFCDCV